jgi:hypothetical protein
MASQHYPKPQPMTPEGKQAHAEAHFLSVSIPTCYSREEKQRRALRVLDLLHVAHPGPQVPA